MGKYRCPHMIVRKGRVPIDCEIMEREAKERKYMPCAFQRYCPKEGKSILTEQALGCLRRKPRKEREETKDEERFAIF